MRKMVLFLFVIMGAALLFSCASPPPPVDVAGPKSRAGEALAKALTANANVAVKADYEKAQALFKEGQGLEATDAAQAVAKYQECERAANGAYNAAVAKREEASKQLEKAKSDIKALETEAGQSTGG